MHVYAYTDLFRPKECRIFAGDAELFPMHSFDNGLCIDDRLGVELLEVAQEIRFKYRTFRFQNVKTINQRARVANFFHEFRGLSPNKFESWI